MSLTDPDTHTTAEKCAICSRPAVKDITYAVTPDLDKPGDPISMLLMPICKEHAVEYDMLGDQAFFDRHTAS